MLGRILNRPLIGPAGFQQPKGKRVKRKLKSRKKCLSKMLYTFKDYVSFVVHLYIILKLGRLIAIGHST